MAIKKSLTLGPLLFNWPVEKKRDFYYKIADETCFDSVYIGEVVCFKRIPLFQAEIPNIVKRLQAAGKEVIYSTPALISDEEELNYLKMLIDDTPGMIEANDISCLNLLEGKAHCLGPYINIYNNAALQFHAKQNAVRVTLPPELPKDSIASLAETRATEIEIQVFGRLPLAISARCPHARAYHLKKANCRFICEKNPDGLDVFTLDQQPFLAVNGLQTLSYTHCNLIQEMDDLQAMGVSAFRLSPHDTDMTIVSKLFHDVLEQQCSADEADKKLRELMPNTAFSNGFYHNQSGYKQIV